MTQTLDPMIARFEKQASIIGADWEECRYVGTDGQRFPRWKLGPRWIEFECGCVAERCPKFWTVPLRCDPVIFQGLPEQAVYDRPCYKHHAWVNSYRAGYGGYKTFEQWKLARRHLLFGVAL